MKKFSLILAIVIGMIGCTGPAGLDGRDGEDGIDGAAEYAKILEFNANFNTGNSYEEIFSFPNAIEVFETDVVMVYIRWKEETLDNGEKVDVWRALPQTSFMNNGSFVYNFDHTFVDIRFFLDGNYDFTSLSPDYVSNQIFRVAIIPAKNAKSLQYDFSSLPAVMQNLNLDTSDILSMD
ncbi:MAG: collagen-like protein [Flavobacteriaceae bacterium]|nr:collagen-like protein [Flavobacteriaceae bacterium]